MLCKPVKIEPDNKGLIFLYKTVPGRIALKLLSSRAVSYVAGSFMDSSLSCSLIPPFAARNNIDMQQYEDEIYTSFNSFFTRHIKPSLRQIDMSDDSFIAPCDGLLSAYHIHDGLVIPVKQSEYSIYDLVKNKRIADMYKNGICLVFRLCVDHYHRYCYPDSGIKSQNVHIKGILHTVRPIALRKDPVFTENSREYTLIKTQNFGTVLMMEVGAMLVGRICNLHEKQEVCKGQEKGYFEYGGSTVILLVKKGKVTLPDILFDATDSGYEIPVKMGERIN